MAKRHYTVTAFRSDMSDILCEISGKPVERQHNTFIIHSNLDKFEIKNFIKANLKKLADGFISEPFFEVKEQPQEQDSEFEIEFYNIHVNDGKPIN